MPKITEPGIGKPGHECLIRHGLSCSKALILFFLLRQEKGEEGQIHTCCPLLPKEIHLSIGSFIQQISPEVHL